MNWRARGGAAVRSLMDYIELRALVGMLLVAAGIWTFVALADEVAEGETHAFDTAVLLALRIGAAIVGPTSTYQLRGSARIEESVGAFGAELALELSWE